MARCQGGTIAKARKTARWYDGSKRKKVAHIAVARTKKVLKAQHWSVVTSLFTIIRMPSEEQTVLRIRLGQFVSKYTVCGKLILPKNGNTFLKFFWATTGMRICMDVQIFASFLYPTLLKICNHKFD